jgi:hypothetical protein
MAPATRRTVITVSSRTATRTARESHTVSASGQRSNAQRTAARSDRKVMAR